MGLINSMRQQTALYWEPVDNDGFGNKSFLAPVELRVRWVKKQEMFKDKFGQEVMSISVIYPPFELNLDGYMYEGSFTDFDSGTDISNPATVDQAFEIRQRATTPKLRNNKKQDRKLEHVWL